MPAPQVAPGRGVNVDELHQIQLDKLKERLAAEHPKVHAEGVELMVAEIRARDATAAFRQSLVEKVGAENVAEAMQLVTRDAEKRVAAERASKRVSGQAPMAGNAANLPQPAS